jgi:hypothetical protein
MSNMQHSPKVVRLVAKSPQLCPTKTMVGMQMRTVPDFLREEADSIVETASRCSDPVIVSELQEIVSELRAKADALENTSSS